MAASTLPSLKFRFDIQGRKLNPGDIIPSSCPPTETMLDGRSVVYSPGGFPLHFTLQLGYYPLASVLCNSAAHWFVLRLHVEQPSDIPCLPPLHIQPMPIYLPRQRLSSPRPHLVYLVRRLVGPQQPANWGFQWDGSLVSTLSGEFRFQLLDEPLHVIANLPPLSKADWSCLPPDMISAVLRELPLADRVSARLVCHEWKRILDTDSLAWSNVTHLQRLGKGLWREDLYGYHDGRLNQVRENKLYKALVFLTCRKAPINSIELVFYSPAEFNEVEQEPIELLPSVLSQHDIKLKAFSLQCPGPLSPDDDFDAAVLQVIRSQPSLERVYLAMPRLVPLPTLLEALPRLRILSLDGILFTGYLEAFQSHLPHLPQLSRLDGLRVNSANPTETALISNSLASHNSNLRRVESVNLPQAYQCSCGCTTRVSPTVWGSGNLSPAAAAFLLMPRHIYAGQSPSVLHHHL